jgi:hypothetical protein
MGRVLGHAALFPPHLNLKRPPTMTLQICPEDEIELILPASAIPDKAKVRKISGVMWYVLSHDILVYRAAGDRPLSIAGSFLMGERGSINQVEPTTRLVWIINAEELVDQLTHSWRSEQ